MFSRTEYRTKCLILFSQVVGLCFCNVSVVWHKRHLLAEGWEDAVAIKMNLAEHTPVIDCKLTSPDACRALVHIDKKDETGNTNYALADIKRVTSKAPRANRQPVENQDASQTVVEMKRLVTQEEIFCTAAARQGLHLLRVNQKWYKRIPPYGITAGLVEDYLKKWFNLGAPTMEVKTGTELNIQIKYSFVRIIDFVRKLSCIKNIQPQYYLLSAGFANGGSGTKFMGFVFDSSKLKNWEFTYRPYGIRKTEIKQIPLSAKIEGELPKPKKLAPGAIRKDGFGIALVTVKNKGGDIQLIGSHLLVAKCHNSRYIMNIIKESTPKEIKSSVQTDNTEEDDEKLQEDTSKLTLKKCFYELVYRLQTWSDSQSHRWKEVAKYSEVGILPNSKNFINYGTAHEFHYFLFQKSGTTAYDSQYVLAVVWIDEDYPDAFILVASVTAKRDNLTAGVLASKDKVHTKLEPNRGFIKEKCPGIEHWETRDGKNGRSSTPIERHLKQHALQHFNFKAHWKVLLLRKERQGKLRMIFGVHYDFNEDNIHLPWNQQTNRSYFCAIVQKKYKSKIKHAQREGFDAEEDVVIALVFKQNEYDAISEAYKLQKEYQNLDTPGKNSIPTPDAITKFIDKWEWRMHIVQKFQSMAQYKMEERAYFYKLNSPTATVAYAVVLYQLNDHTLKECKVYPSMDSLYENSPATGTQFTSNTSPPLIIDKDRDGFTSTSVDDSYSKKGLTDTDVDFNSNQEKEENQLKSRSMDIQTIIVHHMKSFGEQMEEKASAPRKSLDVSEEWDAVVQQTKYAAYLETLKRSHIQYEKDGTLHFYLFETKETEEVPFMYLLLVAYIDNDKVVVVKEATLTLKQICEYNARRTYFKMFKVSIRKRKSIMYREVGRYVISEDIELNPSSESAKILVGSQMKAFREIENKDDLSYYGVSDLIFDEKYHFVRLHSFVFPFGKTVASNDVAVPNKVVKGSLKSPLIKSKMSWKVVVLMTGIDLAQNGEIKVEDVPAKGDLLKEKEEGEEVPQHEALNSTEQETEEEEEERIGEIDNTVQIEPITADLQKRLDNYHTSDTFDVAYDLKAWLGEAFEHYHGWNPINPKRKTLLESYLREFAANQYGITLHCNILLKRNIKTKTIICRNIFHMVFGYHYSSSKTPKKYTTFFCALLHKDYKDMLNDDEPDDVVIALALGQTSQEAINAGYELEMEYILKSTQAVGIAHVAHLQLREDGKDWGILTPVIQNIMQCGIYRIFNFKITTNIGRIGYACVTYIFNEKRRCWVGGGVKIYTSGDKRSNDLKHWANAQPPPAVPVVNEVQQFKQNMFIEEEENIFTIGNLPPPIQVEKEFSKPEPSTDADSDATSKLPEWSLFVDINSVELEEVPIPLETQGWKTLTSTADQQHFHDMLKECRCVVIPNEETVKGKTKYLLTKKGNKEGHLFIIGIIGRTYFFMHKFEKLIVYYCPEIVGFAVALSKAGNYISDYIEWQEATPDMRKHAGGQIQAAAEDVRYYAQINDKHFAIIQNGNKYYLVRQIEGQRYWGFKSYCYETLLRFRKSCALYDLAWKNYLRRSPITWVERVELQKQKVNEHANKRNLIARFLTGVSNFVDNHICLPIYKFFANVLELQERLQMLGFILAAKHQKQVIITGFGVYRDSKPHDSHEKPVTATNDTFNHSEDDLDSLLRKAEDELPAAKTDFTDNLRQQFVVVKLLPFKSLIENTTDDPKCNRFQCISVINFLDQDLNFSPGSFWSSIYPRYSLARDQAEHENRINKC